MAGLAAGTSGHLVTAAAYLLGRGANKMRPAVGSGATRIAPLAGATAIGALWAVVCGWVNVRECRKGGITQGEAIRRTASESVGTGLSAGAGIAAINLVRLSRVAASSALVPFLVGTAVTGGAKVLWDRNVERARLRRRIGGEQDESDSLSAEPSAEQDTPTVSSHD